ncbi:MAG: hypothetical protein J0L58_06745 [Burkholderiales bacterium]|nr:hypothetical protein [Burkholderiales bacterium]
MSSRPGSGHCALFALLLLATSALATADTVRWAVVDGPPFHVDPPGGPARSVDALGDGVTDRLIARLASELPQWRHELLPMSRRQLWARIASGEALCYADAIVTPERLKMTYMSLATVGTPMVLAVRKGSLPPRKEGYRLAELLARSDLRGAFEAQRSYGLEIDGLVRDARAPVMPLPQGPQVLRMLEAGRMDYLVEYPKVLQYAQERMQPAPALDFHALRDIAEPAPAAVACTRTAWGLRAIRAIDGAIRRASARPDATAAHRRWLPPSRPCKSPPTTTPHRSGQSLTGPSLMA